MNIPVTQYNDVCDENDVSFEFENVINNIQKVNNLF